MDSRCPSKTVLSVEHPGHVLSIENALASLGGSSALRKMADDPPACSLELRFRVNDRFEHPIISTTAKTNNILIKIQKIKVAIDETDRMTYQTIAMIKHSVRFRADFQWNTGNSTFLRRLDEVVDCRDVGRVSHFTLSPELSSDMENLDLLPPPVFSTVTVPQFYNFQQNPAARKVETETGLKLINRTRGLRQHLLTVTFEDANVPTEPSPLLVSDPGADLMLLVGKLQELFDRRPMWTRRGIVNELNDLKSFQSIKFALPYVSYMWKAGPWRDCYAKFGIDPRTEPAYAAYQALYFTTKSLPKEWDSSNTVHIFDGTTLFPAGRTYQFVDMTDPILVQIKESAKKRDQPHPRYGWWPARMMQATRAIIRGKMSSLCIGSMPSDVDYRAILEHANDEDEEEKIDNIEQTEKEEDERDEGDEGGEGDDDDEEATNNGTNIGIGGVDQSIDESLDARVDALMETLLFPGQEFDKTEGTAGFDVDESDFEEEDIFGGDSD